MSAAVDYTPSQDSTPGMEEEPGYVTLVMTSDFRTGKWSCPCGCLQVSKTKQFAMGHDAKLRGILIRAHLAGYRIQYVLRVESDGEYIADTGYESSAAVVATWHGWQSALLAAHKRKARAIEDLLDWANDNDATVVKEETAVIAAGYHRVRAVTSLGNKIDARKDD